MFTRRAVIARLHRSSPSTTRSRSHAWARPLRQRGYAEPAPLGAQVEGGGAFGEGRHLILVPERNGRQVVGELPRDLPVEGASDVVIPLGRRPIEQRIDGRAPIA